jgi:hypothetical protein
MHQLYAETSRLQFVRIRGFEKTPFMALGGAGNTLVPDLELQMFGQRQKPNFERTVAAALVGVTDDVRARFIDGQNDIVDQLVGKPEPVDPVVDQRADQP